MVGAEQEVPANHANADEWEWRSNPDFDHETDETHERDQRGKVAKCRPARLRRTPRHLKLRTIGSGSGSLTRSLVVSRNDAVQNQADEFSPSRSSAACPKG